MRPMKKVVESFGFFGVIIGIITGLYVLYHETFEEKNPVINVSIINSNHPTAVSKVDGLLASYKFKNRKVSNLWIEDLKLVNSGNITLVGKGSQKNIIDDSLCFYIRKPFRFLSEIQASGNCGESTYYIANDTTVSIKFVQWRAKEYLDFKLYIEGDTSNIVGPTFYMNDRQIMNGVVKYEPFIGNASGPSLIKDYIKNEGLVTMSGVVGGVLSIGYLVLSLYFIFEVIKSYFDYKKWHVKNYDSYKNKIDILVEEGKLKEFVKPSELPSYFWKLIELEKITLMVDNAKDLIGFTIIFLGVAFGAIGGIMWMIPKFW